MSATPTTTNTPAAATTATTSTPATASTTATTSTPATASTTATTSTPAQETTESTDKPSVFENENTKIIVWVLIGYFGIMAILAIFFKDRLASMQAFSGMVVDMLVFGIVIYYVYYLYDTNKDNSDGVVETLKKEFIQQVNDFNTVINLSLFLIVVQAISYGFRMLTLAGGSPVSLDLINAIGLMYWVILLIANFFKHVLKVDIPGLFSSPEKKTDCKTEPDGGEVFNISNNVYSYEEARQMCSSFGARLANYDEVEKAYNGGGEWCNYGWSEGQMILYPTQKDTWSVLQRNKKRANDCGRPGINGGYIVNPNVRFGANCYGKKPTASDVDLQRMNAAKILDATPKSDAEKEMDEKVRQWKNITVSPFNKNKWSTY
jgi:hypothetical protein